MSPAKRIEYIDLAKGICILLVVVDHISNEGYFQNGNYPLNEVFDQMRMPLYFILSGLFFKDYAGGIREFLLRKVNKILIPYLFFLIPLRLLTLLAYRYTDYGHEVEATWGPLWFLRCLFLMNVIFAAVYYIVQRTTNGALWRDLLLSVSMLAIGIVGYRAGNLHLNFGSVMTCMPFLWAGFFMNRRLHLLNLIGNGRMKAEKEPPGAGSDGTPPKQEQEGASRQETGDSSTLNSRLSILNYQFSIIKSLLAITLLVLLHFLYVGENHFYSNDYSSPLPLLYFAGLAGTLAVLLLSSTVQRLPILSYIGRYSIIVLCTHQAVLELVLPFVRMLEALPLLPLQGGSRECLGSWADPFGPLQSLLVLVLTIAGSMLCCRFFKRYFPKFTAQQDLIKV